MPGKSKKYSDDLLEYMPVNPTDEDLDIRVQSLYKHYQIDDNVVCQMFSLTGKKPSIPALYMFKQECLIIKMAQELGIPAFLHENISNKIREYAKRVNKLIDFAMITTIKFQYKTSITNAIMRYQTHIGSERSFDAVKKEYERFKNDPIITKKFYNKEFIQKIVDKLGLDIVIKDEYVEKIGDLAMLQVAQKKSYKEFAEYKDILKGKKRTNTIAEEMIALALPMLIV